MYSKLKTKVSITLLVHFTMLLDIIGQRENSYTYSN